jgi:uncharacterized protein YlxP (DUF503 family)
MVVGVCHLDIIIHDNNSLKGKRHILKQIIERTKHKFNVSIAEVGDNDLWQRAKIGFSVVGNDNRFVNSCLDKIMNFIENMEIAEVVDSEWEIIHY